MTDQISAAESIDKSTTSDSVADNYFTNLQHSPRLADMYQWSTMMVRYTQRSRDRQQF